MQAFYLDIDVKRVYGQFCIETIHGRLNWKREFSGLFAATCSGMALQSVLLIWIGKQNVEIKYK